MPIPTVEYFEEFIDIKLKTSLIGISKILSLALNIPYKTVLSAPSLLSLAQTYRVPKELIQHELIGVIPYLMAEYAEYLCIRNNTLWQTAPHQQKQRNFAYTVTLLCDQSRLDHDVNHIKEHCIKTIQLMLLNNRTETRSSIDDAFSPLIQALINKTSGVDGWDFGKVMIQKSDDISSYAVNV